MTGPEVISVSASTAELFVGGEIVVLDGLEPETTYLEQGCSFTTLEDLGPVRSRVATMNDVHFGETECGRQGDVVGTGISVEPGEPPYPETMNASVVADAAARAVDAVLVKGDLTDLGTAEEYEAFLNCYLPVFGPSLTWVRGNHDSYPGGDYAAWPLQIVDVPGARLLLLDTAREYRIDGAVSTAQVAGVVEAAREVSVPVLVFGHHPVALDDGELGEKHTINPADSSALLEALEPLDQVLGYFAGHTHRCRRRQWGHLALVEVASVKDFPGAWAEYQIHDAGVTQVLHRASAPAAVAWAERTRELYGGLYGAFAAGNLEDRSFVLRR